MLFHGEQDGQRVERIDPGVSQLRRWRKLFVRDVLLLPYDVGELLLDFGAGHMRDYRFPALYVAWILFCALLFFALRGAEDPSRRSGRILSTDAGRLALAELKRPGYVVVHVAWARAAEGAPEQRWIVLLDRIPHTALREAVVVELRAEDGALLRIRKPVT